MAKPFLYAFPKYYGSGDALNADLDEYGLRPVLEGVKMRSGKIEANNVLGGIKCVMTISGDNETEFIKYEADRQTWHKNPAGYWLGFYNDARPDAETLYRGEALNATIRELADGTEWGIPLALFQDRSIATPHVFGLDDAGEFVRKPKPQYAEFSRLANEYFDIVAGADWVIDANKDEKIQAQLLQDLAVAALSVAYRVDRFHIGALELIDDTVIFRIAMATIGYDWARALAEDKKKDTAGDG